MVTQERRAYLEAVEKRYREASKQSKAVILDEFVRCVVTTVSMPYGC